jgi:hypothetical protein
MSIIHYKYIVGDIVMFKVSFRNPTLANKAGQTAKISGLALAYNNEPHYYLDGEVAIYPESCFAGRYEE